MSSSGLRAATKRSRYFDNGSPTKCFYCRWRFDGSAIRDRETNRYFCCDACLESAQFLGINRPLLPQRKSA